MMQRKRNAFSLCNLAQASSRHQKLTCSATSLSMAQKQFHYWGVNIEDIREEGFPSTSTDPLIT